MQILIVGCARNVEQKITKSISNLYRCFEKLGDVSFHIIESDSTDQTLTVLHSLKYHYDLSFVSCGNIGNIFPKRTDRLAHCRNKYVEYINSINKSDMYIVVADLDGINDALTPDAVATCFTRTGWDVVTANQAGPYYDVWALRKQDWQLDDCWKNYNFLVKHGVQRNIALISTVLSRQIIIDQKIDWIPVLSAFGGIAIYKADCFKNNRYVGLNVDGTETCEHVAFNLNIIKGGGNIFINPAFINSGYNEHTQRHKAFYENNIRRKD